ncbi:geranylgeranyl transferase type-1 subunit beta-like isoform X2 [Oscarella lobularis]
MELLRAKHVKYLNRCLGILPQSSEMHDTNRMTICFFALSGLDLLDALNLSETEKKSIIDWIYAQQVQPDGENASQCGFRGSPVVGSPFIVQDKWIPIPFDCSHITMTYTALASLLILGDDLSRVNRKAIVSGLKGLQLVDGSYFAVPFGGENDMRFLYCACCISAILGDWRGVDQTKAVDFIVKSQGYDYGIGQGPNQESHGGSTFCAIASLALMNRLESAFDERQLEGLKKWCLNRQQSGFNGRPNKPVDTCYSFWIGASLKLLGCYDFVNEDLIRGFTLSTQSTVIGGLSKWPDCHPDPLHTYLGLCGLSLMNESGLQPIHPALNISRRATVAAKLLL